MTAARDKWRKDNPEKVKEYKRRWRHKNLEKVNKQSREIRKANPERTKLSQRKSSLKSQYGLTLEQFDLLSKSQNYECRICNRKIKLCVDHDHKTGKVRGLLCSRCNRCIGQFEENVIFLKNAIKYIKETK